MKIIRYEDAKENIGYAAQQPDGSALRIQGDIFGQYRLTKDRAEVKKLLAPVVPAAFLCIGLNYRQHAAETNAKIPQFPVLFMKSPAAQVTVHLAFPEEPACTVPGFLVKSTVQTPPLSPVMLNSYTEFTLWEMSGLATSFCAIFSSK